MTWLFLLALLTLPLAAQTPVDLSGPVRGEMTVHGSPSTLVVGVCSVTAPCNVRQGTLVRSYVTPSTVNILAGTGTAYIYIDPSGNIVAGVPAGLTVTCGGCLVTGTTGFPAGSVPLATWTASAGQWTRGIDQTALLSVGPAYIAGPRVTLIQTPNTLTIGAQ